MVDNSSIVLSPRTKDLYWFEHIKGNLSENKVLGICCVNWLGIKHATINQCSDVLLIEGVNDLKHAELISDFIQKNNFQKIAINGLPDYIEKLIEILHSKNPQILIYVIFHGSLTQHLIDPDVNDRFNRLYPFFPFIHKFGFVKKDMDKIFSLVVNKAGFLPNLDSPVLAPPRIETGNPLKIGALIESVWRKNNFNQILAGCLVENSEVHVLSFPQIDYMDNILKGKIIKHGILPEKEFKQLLRSMDINCYASLTECYPMVFIESLTQGIPCLIAKTSEYIVENYPEIKNYLVIQNPEDIFEIKEKINQIVKNYSTVVNLCHNFIVKLLEINKKMILDFFNS